MQKAKNEVTNLADVHTKDLTTGSPMKLILSFMLPLVFGLLFQQVYSMVDTIVVGKFLGVDALAGVGSTGSITFLVLGLCNGVCAGFAIPVAQKFGQRDFDGLRRFVGNMIWLSCVIAAAVTLVTTLLCRQILLWMDTPADTFSFAYDYIFVIFLGIPATMLYNLLSGILRSLGDSKTPLVFLIMCSLLNVVLDIVFILTLNMGVAGAGWATLLSQLISGVLCLYFIVKKFPILHLKQDDLRLRKIYVRKLLNMGLPMGLQYSITAVGSILLQTAVNGLGATAMAAIAAGSRVSMLLQGVKDCTVLGIIISAAIFVITWFGGSAMTTLFLDTADGASVDTVVPMGQQFLLINAAFAIPLLFVNLLRFTIQGLGYSEFAVFAGVFEMVARGAFGLCLVPVLGYTAACFASPAAWVMADVFLFPAYFHCMKKQGYSFKPEKVSVATE